jgi:hypothetical protein
MPIVIPLQRALGRRCPSGIPEGVLAPIVRTLEEVMQAVPRSSRVFVGGSFGRGEPCIRADGDGRPVVLSDFDVKVVVEDTCGIEAATRKSRAVQLDRHVMRPAVFPRMGLLCSDCIEVVDVDRVTVGRETCKPGDAAELLTFSTVEMMSTVLPQCLRSADPGQESIQRSIHRSVVYNLRAAKITSGYATFLSEWPGGGEPEVSRRNASWRCGGSEVITITDVWDSYSLAVARFRTSSQQAWSESLEQRRRTAGTTYAEWVGHMALRAMDALVALHPERLSREVLESAWRSANSELEVSVEQPLDQFFQEHAQAFKQALYDHKVFGAGS